MLSSKKIYLYVQGLCESQNSLPPSPYPLYIKCLLIQYSHREGGGGELNKREEERCKQFTKLGRKHQLDGLYLQSI